MDSITASTTLQPDGKEDVMPNGIYRDPEGYVSLALDVRRSVTILTSNPEYLIAVAYEALKPLGELTAPGREELTERHRDVLEGVSLLVESLLYVEPASLDDVPEPEAVTEYSR